MYDFEKIFTSVKTDPNWVKKFLIGSVLMFVPVIFQCFYQFVPAKNPELEAKFFPYILCGFIIVCIFTMLVNGYYYKTINTKIHRTSEFLPEWKNIKEYFLISLKIFAGIFIYMLPVILILLVLVGLCIALKSVNPVMMIIPIILILLIFISFIILMSLVNLSFAYDLKLSSYFNFKRIGLMLKNNFVNYLLFLTITIALTSLFKIAAGLLGLSIIGIVAVPFLAFYSYLVLAEVAAQFIHSSQLIPAPIAQEIQSNENEQESN